MNGKEENFNPKEPSAEEPRDLNKKLHKSLPKIHALSKGEMEELDGGHKNGWKQRLTNWQLNCP